MGYSLHHAVPMIKAVASRARKGIVIETQDWGQVSYFLGPANSITHSHR